MSIDDELASAFPLTRRLVGGVEMEVFDRGPRTLREAFLTLHAHGDAEALAFEGDRWTYRRQHETVVRLANSLSAHYGVTKGTRVAIALRNYPEWVAIFWATQLLGAVAIPVNAWLTGAEMAALLADALPAVIFADAERVARLATTDFPVVGVRTAADSGPATRFEDLVGPDVPLSVPEVDLADIDLATIIYTSGTTGRPKGVLGTHLNHVTTLLSMRRRAEGGRLLGLARGTAAPAHSREPTLLVLPLFHVAGVHLMMSNQFAGRLVLLMYKWDIAEAAKLIETERVAETTGPPIIVRQILDAVATGQLDASSLRSLGSGTSLAPPQLILDIAATFDHPVSPVTGYGLTETTSAVLAISGPDYLQRPTSIGRPQPTVRTRIVDESGAPVPDGEAGELELAGPQITPGYAGRPELTAEAFRDGWFRTGDRVRADADGFFHLVGRIKDIVVRAGENVYCAEVESAIGAHPDVVEAAVFGRPHSQLGEEVVALVRLRPGQELTVTALRAFLAPHLAAFKIPADAAFVTDPLPRTATGKLLKQQLRMPPGTGAPA